MLQELIPFIFFAVIAFSLLAGYPVAFTLGGVSVLFGGILFGFDFFELLPLRVWGIMSNYVLVSAPMFIFMGVMFERSGIAEELLETMALLFGRMRGGLAISVLVVGALLGASTGIVGATIVTLGVLSIPVMLKRGCSPTDSCGVVAASGTLGQIIPPSIILILLGSTLNISIGDLFLGAVIPGMMLVLLYIGWIVVLNKIRPNAFPAFPEEEIQKFQKNKLRKIVTAFLLPSVLVLLVLGSMFMGIASPTEAAAVGAMGATVLAIIRKKFSKETLMHVSKKTAVITSMAFMILVGATAFSLVFRGLHGDRVLTEMIIAAEIGPELFLLIVMLIIFLAGFLIDFIEIIFIIVPIVAPVFQNHYQMDLLWIGILIAMNLQTSFMTPPFGFALFYLKGVTPPEIKTTHIYKGVIPYISIILICLMLMYFFPQLALWLPGVMK